MGSCYTCSTKCSLSTLKYVFIRYRNCLALHQVNSFCTSKHSRSCNPDVLQPGIISSDHTEQYYPDSWGSVYEVDNPTMCSSRKFYFDAEVLCRQPLQYSVRKNCLWCLFTVCAMLLFKLLFWPFIFSTLLTTPVGHITHKVERCECYRRSMLL